MTYRSLLVLLDQGPLCAARVGVAMRLARDLDGHLLGLAPTGPIETPFVPDAYANFAALAALAWDPPRQQAREAAQRFRDACGDAGWNESRDADARTLRTGLDNLNRWLLWHWQTPGRPGDHRPALPVRPLHDGGGLDIAFLGLAQADAEGSLNVSRFGDRLAGAGGVINVSQNARQVVFAGSFLAPPADGGGPLVRKFVRRVEQITFSGEQARRRGHQVLYVTERCVFALHLRGLALVEVAPGLDIDRDILAWMNFRPVIERAPATMDPAIFADAPMGLHARPLLLPLDERLSLGAEVDGSAGASAPRTMFINFEHLAVRCRDDVDAVRQAVERRFAPLAGKVHAVVHYDHFTLDTEVADDWAAMVSGLGDRHYLSVTRYSTSGFLRAKQGPAPAARGVAPHIFESADEARAHLQREAPEGAQSRVVSLHGRLSPTSP